MKLDWEDEVKLLLSGNWRPCLRGGFSLVCGTGRGEWILWPPQGVYAQWTGRFTPDARGGPVTVHADTACAALDLLKKIEDR